MHNVVLWDGEFSAFTVSNTTEDPQEVKLLINDTVPFGSFENIEELLSYVVAGLNTDEEILRAVYEFFDNSRMNFCSEASPYLEVREEENLMHRLFSYSFACCSDVNPMIGYAFQLLGYEATMISNPRHVMSTVSIEEQDFIVDASLHSFVAGSLYEGLENSFNFSELDPGMQYLYSDIFVNDGEANSLHAPDEKGYAPNNLPTDFPVYLAPGEQFTFNNEWTADRAVTYPMLTQEVIDEIGYEESTFSYLGNGTLSHNLSAHALEGKVDGCRIYELESPYVIIDAAIHDLDESSLEGLYFSSNALEWASMDVSLSDFTINYHLFSDGVHELLLDLNNVRDDWGGFSYRIYIDILTINHLMADKLHDYDFVLYENDFPLPYPNAEGILEEGAGRYVFYDLEGANMLLFSTSDNSDPRTNGYEYKISYTGYTSLDEPFGRYNYYLKACPSTPGDFSFEDTIQVETQFQYNRLLLPEEIQSIENLNSQLSVSLTK